MPINGDNPTTPRTGVTEFREEKFLWKVRRFNVLSKIRKMKINYKCVNHTLVNIFKLLNNTKICVVLRIVKSSFHLKKNIYFKFIPNEIHQCLIRVNMRIRCRPASTLWIIADFFLSPMGDLKIELKWLTWLIQLDFGWLIQLDFLRVL